MHIRVEPNTHEFWEYAYVQRHTRDLELLRFLHGLSVDADEASRLADLIASEFGWKSQPTVSFTGRNPSRGTYIEAHKARGKRGGTRRVKARVVVTDPTPVEVLIHELAHHHVKTVVTGETRDHGYEFVRTLDRFALMVESIL